MFRKISKKFFSTLKASDSEDYGPYWTDFGLRP